MHYYFAYGSNMNWAQIIGRCPFARVLTIARLADHRLAFTRMSVNRGCGVADIVHAAGRQVWGVVFGISDLDLGSLDKSEGFRPGRDRNSYIRRECTVLLDGDEGRPLLVETYFAEHQPNPPLPNQAYKDQILAGAKCWHLPTAYIAELERIEVRK